jgi:hypothetical protein
MNRRGDWYRGCPVLADEAVPSEPLSTSNFLLTGKSQKSKSARSANSIRVYHVANQCRQGSVADARRQLYSPQCP